MAKVTDWSREEDRRALDLYRRGYPMRAIAERLTAAFSRRTFTKNSVIGRIGRLRHERALRGMAPVLPARAATIDGAEREKVRRRVSAPKPNTTRPKEPPRPASAPPRPPQGEATRAGQWILHLERDQCRYALPDWRPCAGRRAHGSAYCAEHDAICRASRVPVWADVTALTPARA